MKLLFVAVLPCSILERQNCSSVYVLDQLTKNIFVSLGNTGWGSCFKFMKT